MWLANSPRVRIKEYPKGYAVETQKMTWYGRKYWIHIKAVSSIDKEPWLYTTKETAIREALKHFEWDILINSE